MTALFEPSLNQLLVDPLCSFPDETLFHHSDHRIIPDTLSNHAFVNPYTEIEVCFEFWTRFFHR